MTTRQKTGVALLIGAALSAVYGVVALVLPSDPAWLTTVATRHTSSGRKLGDDMEGT